MVRLNRIYTRTGDKGTTGLGDGSRRPKHSLRIVALGDVDEANAAIGLARAHVRRSRADGMLGDIQNDLFDLGADLCVPTKKGDKERLRVIDKQVERLEQEIDEMNALLTRLTSFVLPGGAPAGAHIHFARAVVRRAERSTVQLASKETVSPAVVRYLNRLSDHLFVLARLVNKPWNRETLWVPGLTRDKERKPIFGTPPDEE